MPKEMQLGFGLDCSPQDLLAVVMLRRCQENKTQTGRGDEKMETIRAGRETPKGTPITEVELLQAQRTRNLCATSCQKRVSYLDVCERTFPTGVRPGVGSMLAQNV